MISLKKKEPISKNEQAEAVFGLRTLGTPIQEPFELDYACPICCPPITETNGIFTAIFTEDGWLKAEFGRLQFSEYNGFMWCSHCNLDIPSFLCLRANTREAVEIYTDRFIDFGRKFKERLLASLPEGTKDLLVLQEKIGHLQFKLAVQKRRNHHLQNAQKYLRMAWINRLLLKWFAFRHRRTRKGVERV